MSLDPADIENGVYKIISVAYPTQEVVLLNHTAILWLHRRTRTQVSGWL